MFGYVLANRGTLTQEQADRYRSCYCGLCKAIRDRHGQLPRLTLTYDMTFLILLLDSLHEPELQQREERCLVHPLHPHPLRRSKWTDYAADMNVALAYHNCLDDWQDDRSLPKWTAARLLRSSYGDIQARWPGQCRCMEDCLARLSALEGENSADLDAAAHCFGDLMSGLFAVGDPFWHKTLASVGHSLGQFIYVMDAVLDREEDQQRDRYNPVTAFCSSHGSFDAWQTLNLLMGDCTLAFETLPLEQDLDLLRNILYSGVWGRWTAAQAKKTGAQEDSQA